jgi:hypothetical protein
MSSCHHHPIVGRGPKIGGPQNGWETLQAKFFARYGITTAQAGHGRSPSPVRLMEHPLLSFIIYGMKHGLYMDYTYSMTHIKAIFHPIYIYMYTTDPIREMHIQVFQMPKNAGGISTLVRCVYISRRKRSRIGF